MTKPTKWHVCPAKTQISLGFRGCPGWSESSLDAHIILLVLSWGGSCFLTSRHFYLNLNENAVIPFSEETRSDLYTEQKWKHYKLIVRNLSVTLIRVRNKKAKSFKRLGSWLCVKADGWWLEPTDKREWDSFFRAHHEHQCCPLAAIRIQKVGVQTPK